MKKRSFCFRISWQQMFKTSGFFRFGQKYLKKVFYNFVKHSRSCGLNLICEFKTVLLTYSQLGFARFSFRIVFFFETVFRNILPHIGSLNKYRVLNNNLNAKNTQYSVASNYILLCHTEHCNA